MMTACKKVTAACFSLIFLLFAGLSEYTEDNTTFDMPKIHKKENENWYASSSNLEADPSLFHKKARQELEKMENQAAAMRQEAEEDSVSRERLKQVNTLEKKLERAGRDYKNYAASSNVSSAEMRTAFEGSMNALNGEFQKTASSILSPEEAGRWALESKVEDRSYQIQQLKSALGNLNQDLKTQRQLESRISKLEEANKEAADKLKKTKDGGETPWKDFQKELESDLKEFDNDYLKTLSDVKKSR